MMKMIVVVICLFNFKVALADFVCEFDCQKEIDTILDKLSDFDKIDFQIRKDAIDEITNAAVESKYDSVKLKALSALQEPMNSFFHNIIRKAIEGAFQVGRSSKDELVQLNTLAALGTVMRKKDKSLHRQLMSDIRYFAKDSELQSVKEKAIELLETEKDSPLEEIRINVIRWSEDIKKSMK